MSGSTDSDWLSYINILKGEILQWGHLFPRRTPEELKRFATQEKICRDTVKDNAGRLAEKLSNGGPEADI